MERFFYTDPLAAAWLSKHFGMRFVQIVNKAGFGQLSRNDGGAFAPRYIEQLDYPDAEQFYLHPDCLPLLEPQIGDMISHLGMRAWRIDGVDERTYTHAAFGVEKLDRFTFKSDNPRIIQRGGLAFHWPEREP